MRILVVDDDPAIRDLLHSFLVEVGHEPDLAGSGAEALEQFARTPYDLFLLDLYMPGIDGLEVLRQVKASNPACEVVIITAYGSLPTAVQALNMGAYAYVNKPFDLIELERLIERVKELVELRCAYHLLAQERLRAHSLSNLVAVSPVMQEVRTQIEALCMHVEPILIYGEAGVGKRFISRIIHFNGIVRESLVLQLNVSEIESWLATRRYLHANGITLAATELPNDLFRQGYGTLILNQVNGLDPATQLALAALITERGSFLRPRGELPGFRLIALAETHTGGLEECVIPELLAVFKDHLYIPALRERAECIIPAAHLFFGRYVNESGGRGFYISQPVQEFLRMYQWPGNLRELEYLVNRLSIICTSRLVSARDLQQVHKELVENREIQGRSLEDLVTLAEKQALKRTFRRKEDD